MIWSMRRVELFQRAVERSQERSDVKPEVPIDLREFFFNLIELLQTDFHSYHLLSRRCRLNQSPVIAIDTRSSRIVAWNKESVHSFFSVDGFFVSTRMEEHF